MPLRQQTYMIYVCSECGAKTSGEDHWHPNGITAKSVHIEVVPVERVEQAFNEGRREGQISAGGG